MRFNMNEEPIIDQLMRIIGPMQTAYIGDAKSVEEVCRWSKEGLESTLERRMQLALKVSRIICDSESELKTQGWLIGRNSHLDGDSPVRLLKECDIATIEPKLIAAAKAFVSNAAQNLFDVESRLRSVIKDSVRCPPGVTYVCDRLQDRLSLGLVYINQEVAVTTQRNWDLGLYWPGWEAIAAAVPEMKLARTEVEISQGCPLKLLRTEKHVDM